MSDYTINKMGDLVSGNYGAKVMANRESANLEGEFTLDELERIVSWMKCEQESSASIDKDFKVEE